MGVYLADYVIFTANFHGSLLQASFTRLTSMGFLRPQKFVIKLHMQKIISDLKITNGGILELMVLKMLSSKQGSYSAQEIFENLKQSGFKTPMGSIHPLLAKLRQKDYIVKDREEDDSMYILITYHLSTKGQIHLKNLRGDWKRLNQLIASIGAE